MASSGGGLDFDDVTNKGVIGQGAFGCVYLVENSQKEQFAVKVMEWDRMGMDREVAENELRVLKELNHDHVLVYVDSFVQRGLMYILTEFCAGGDLSGFLDASGKPVPEDLLLVWLWQMACGLEYMHMSNPPVLHRDLKPSNIYLTDTGDIRLGDMGIARILDAPNAMATTFCGTPPYMSPEALYEKPYNAKTDVWSLGCCVVEMATLRRAYDGSSIYILRSVVMKMREPLPDKFSKLLDGIVAKMLLPEYEERISVTEILDSDLLEKCAAKGETPVDLLKRHGLLRCLAMHRQPLQPKDDKTIHTLTDSMANLKEILTEGGEEITTFRIKKDNRMCGRRQDRTLVNTESLKTVLYKPSQKMKSKTTKVVPKVPGKSSQPPEPSDAMAKPMMSAFASTLSTMKAKKPDEPKASGAERQPPAADASSSSMITQLRKTLKQVVGQDSIIKADALVRGAANAADLQSGLESVLQASGGSDVTLLSQIFLYLVLKDSVKPAAGSTS
ncbi:uncharacterized protein [Littorina saxatilis]|uniref:non-specific serine/threonine protein kinase n=1 Tax=Littorina saxatilis TaxID=31220 RepID=A0AAN9B8T6_9CAEN